MHRLTLQLFPVIIFPPSQHSLHNEGGHNTRHKQRDHRPGVPARLQPRAMLSKQQEIVDHGPQLQVVVHSPADHEAAEDRGAQHEEPFLDPERDEPHNHRSHHSPNNRNVDMFAEERDIDGGENKPRQKKTDAGTGEKNPDIVDTDSEDSTDNSHNY